MIVLADGLEPLGASAMAFAGTMVTKIESWLSTEPALEVLIIYSNAWNSEYKVYIS